MSKKLSFNPYCSRQSQCVRITFETNNRHDNRIMYPSEEIRLPLPIKQNKKYIFSALNFEDLLPEFILKDNIPVLLPHKLHSFLFWPNILFADDWVSDIQHFVESDCFKVYLTLKSLISLVN